MNRYNYRFVYRWMFRSKEPWTSVPLDQPSYAVAKKERIPFAPPVIDHYSPRCSKSMFFRAATVVARGGKSNFQHSSKAIQTSPASGTSGMMIVSRCWKACGDLKPMQAKFAGCGATG